MKHYFNSLRKSIGVVSILCLGASCSDTWDDHYSMDMSIIPDKSISERLSSTDGIDQFVEALKTTYMFNGSKQTDITYYEFLNSDQFVTVWAPQNSAFADWSAYTKKNKTRAENLEVGKKMIMNHIARFSHPVGSSTAERVMMFSEKRYYSDSVSIDNIRYDETKKNLPCTNGILHVLKDGSRIVYSPSIYEFLTEGNEQYKYEELGRYWEMYTKEELDENKSVALGYNKNGEMEYIDSVTTKWSILMNKFGYIDEEDSNYVMVLPTPEAWAEQYDLTKKKFDYGNVIAADSIGKYWSYDALFTDMFFNMNINEHTYLPDSVVSTTFSASNAKYLKQYYHTYKNPYSSNGLFKKNVIDTISCSNGKIYITDKWAYNADSVYNAPKKYEAENLSFYTQISGSYVATYTTLRTIVNKGDTIKGISQDAVLEVSGEKGAVAWSLAFNITNNLKGKYRLYAAIVPNKDFLPNAIHPVVYYNSAVIFDPKDARRRDQVFYSEAKKIGLVDFGEIDIPTCNYQQNDAKLKVLLKSVMRTSETSKYSSTMRLDYILLVPSDNTSYEIK